jgi:two-component system sensor histidine kinase UhpB
MSERLLQEQKRYQNLLTQQVIAAQEKERAHIGRELHDNVNQVLTTVKLYLETVLNKEETKDPFISKSMQLVNGSINEIRNLSHQLSAPTLGTGSLTDAINALIEMVVSSSGLLVEFDNRAYCKTIVMDQQLAIYRIVQEQLNNVIKHAAADKAWISLKQTATHIILLVKDNGKGFTVSEKSHGIGFNNIITRVQSFDGNITIESALQKGCELKVVLPMVFENEKAGDRLH